MNEPSTDLTDDFKKLVFWDAVRSHRKVDPQFVKAQEMGLDTAEMLRTYDLRVAHYATLMGLSIPDATVRILAAVITYEDALRDATLEWEQLMLHHQGDLPKATKVALTAKWLTAFSTNSGMDAAEALAYLTLYI